MPPDTFGVGSSRKVASMISPRLPNDPASSATRSRPPAAASSALLTIVPSARTAVMLASRSRGVPKP